VEFEAGHIVYEARSNPGVAKALHIRLAPRDDRTAIPFEAALVDGQLSVETFEDVYRGLARLCRVDLDPPFAVLVCVDALLPGEYEFFSVASSIRRNVPIYVYGGRGSASSIAEAIELGATGEATLDAVESLIRATSVPQAEPVPADREEDPGSADLERIAASEFLPMPAPACQEPAAVETIAGSTEGEPSSVAADDGPKEKSAEAAPPDQARVPWLHYADRPAREGPKRRSPPASGPDDSEEETARLAAPHAPLLTDAELEALMGDDIAAIAPAEESPHVGEDDLPQGDVP